MCSSSEFHHICGFSCLDDYLETQGNSVQVASTMLVEMKITMNSWTPTHDNVCRLIDHNHDDVFYQICSAADDVCHRAARMSVLGSTASTMMSIIGAAIVTMMSVIGATITTMMSVIGSASLARMSVLGVHVHGIQRVGRT